MRNIIKLSAIVFMGLVFSAGAMAVSCQEDQDAMMAYISDNGYISTINSREYPSVAITEISNVEEDEDHATVCLALANDGAYFAGWVKGMWQLTIIAAPYEEE